MCESVVKKKFTYDTQNKIFCVQYVRRYVNVYICVDEIGQSFKLNQNIVHFVMSCVLILISFVFPLSGICPSPVKNTINGSVPSANIIIVPKKSIVRKITSTQKQKIRIKNINKILLLLFVFFTPYVCARVHANKKLIHDIILYFHICFYMIIIIFKFISCSFCCLFSCIALLS